MILSDTSIQHRIDSNDIIVQPTPTETQYQPASLDIRIDSELYNCETESYSSSDIIRLEPHTRYLGQTVERITLPTDLAVQLAGRSTLGRMGVIIHKTAGWIDPGFDGTITLELYNLSDEPVEIPAQTRIGQLVFLQLDSKSTGYNGQYQGQTSPKPPQSLQD